MKDYCEPTNLSVEDLEKEIKRLEEESNKLAEWPVVD